jgi:hypothetical protein
MLTNKVKTSETVFESSSAFPACETASHAFCNYRISGIRDAYTQFAYTLNSSADTEFPVFLELAGKFTILQT